MAVHARVGSQLLGSFCQGTCQHIPARAPAPAVHLQLLIDPMSYTLRQLSTAVCCVCNLDLCCHLQHQADCKRCHALVHQRGAAHFAAHCYSAAIELLTPAVFFATSLTAGKSARLLAMSLLKSNQPGRAMEYVALAEQREGSVSAAGCLIQLQAAVQLQQQANQAAAAAAKKAAVGAGDWLTAAAAASIAAAEAAAGDAAAAAAVVLDAARHLGSAADLSSEAMQVRLRVEAGWYLLHAIKVRV